MNNSIKKNAAIKSVMAKNPAMSEATAKYYVEEVLGYFQD